MADAGQRTVTAIVVGYNHAHCLGRCLDSLIGQRGLDSLEVIYVDNASSDSSVAITSRHPGVLVIQNERNEGFARAVNQGLARASGRYVALVNPDTELAPGTIDELVVSLERHPGVELVGPSLIDEEGGEQLSLSPYPTVGGLMRKLLGLRPAAGDAWLLGAFVVARTGQLRERGGLDERYFVYGEDMELSRGVQRAGGQIRVETDVQVRHTGNPRWTPDRLARVYGAYLRFLGHHEPRQRLPVGLALSLLWLLRGGLAGARTNELTRGLRRIWSTGRDAPQEGGR
jgi:GT2 family glycosyltransferase